MLAQQPDDPFRVDIRVDKGLQTNLLIKRKLLKAMVRPARFERATFCSGGKRSIQLSYGRSGKSLHIVYQRAECAFAEQSCPVQDDPKRGEYFQYKRILKIQRSGEGTPRVKASHDAECSRFGIFLCACWRQEKL